ncbi:hypothetical protein FOZ63_023628, partial [Perkinsus olseni]
KTTEAIKSCSSERYSRFNPKTGKYQHAFVPFMMAIVDCECKATYKYALQKLNWLVKELTLGLSTDMGYLGLEGCVPFVVHDAHQGALTAARSELPGARNGRCYFHITKNIKDKKKTLGTAYDLVRPRYERFRRVET